MTPTELFKTIRDIPYRIPISPGEKSNNCSGKHKQLKELLDQQGIKSRYRVCTFLWSTLNLPKEISSKPHSDLSTHVWLEVHIEGTWQIVDATWDIGLRNILPISNWNGKSDTETAVKPLEIFTPQKSAEIMSQESPEETLSDLKINRKFYQAFNNWLEEQRIKP